MQFSLPAMAESGLSGCSYMSSSDNMGFVCYRCVQHCGHETGGLSHEPVDPGTKDVDSFMSSGVGGVLLPSLNICSRSL